MYPAVVISYHSPPALSRPLLPAWLFEQFLPGERTSKSTLRRTSASLDDLKVGDRVTVLKIKGTDYGYRRARSTYVGVEGEGEGEGEGWSV